MKEEMTEEQKQELHDNEWEVIEDDKFSLCKDCPLNRVCTKAFYQRSNEKYNEHTLREIDCYYERNGLWGEKRRLFNKWQSFVDEDPKFMMEGMMSNYMMLEEEAKMDYTFAKGMQMQYLLMSIYKMKFGEKKQIESNTTSATVDVKAILDKMRDSKGEIEE